MKLDTRTMFPSTALALAGAALLGGAGWLAAQQSPAAARPQFDVASIKSNPSLSLRHVLLPPTGGRLSTRMASLRLLIQNAYGVESFQISGGPAWMDSAGFDLDAKAGGNPPRSQVWLMLQTLLEERFRLAVHRETRQLPVYALTAAKGGLKLPAGDEAACAEANPGPAPRGSGPPPGPCSYATISFESTTGLSVIGRQVVMADLVKVLQGLLQRPVVDRTGFTGKFDVAMPFAYDEGVTVGIGNPWPQASRPDTAANPPLLDALQRQLGLKAEPSKGPVEMLVIDRAERPTEN